MFRSIITFIALASLLMLPVSCGPTAYVFDVELRQPSASGLDLAEYRRRGGADFTPQQRAFLAHCQQAGYLTLTPSRLTLTPLGMIVQNAILEELI